MIENDRDICHTYFISLAMFGSLNEAFGDTKIDSSIPLFSLVDR